jgi:hypothetical protein
MIKRTKAKVKSLLDKTDIDEKILERSRKIKRSTVSKAKEFKREMQKNIVKAVVAAFAFIIALTWRDVIKDGVNTLVKYFNITTGTYIYEILAALIVTVVCVIGVILVSRMKQD